MPRAGIPGGGRRLRLPTSTTPLDRAWDRQQLRLQQAHDDWALHANSGNPRGPAHQAAGLVRFRRKTVRDGVQAIRRIAADDGADREMTMAVRQRLDGSIRDYRRAVAELARAVADFNDRNDRMLRAVGGLLDGGCAKMPLGTSPAQAAGDYSTSSSS